MKTSKDKKLVLKFTAGLIFLATGLLFFACAPKVEDKKVHVETLSRGPLLQDTNLENSLSNGNASESSAATTNLIRPENQIQLLSQLESEFSIGQILSSPDWKNRAADDFRNFQQTQTFESLKTSNSVYLEIVDRQINSTVVTSVTEAQQQLSRDVETVNALILNLKKQYLILKPESLLFNKINVTKTFIEKIISNATDLQIMPEFKSLLISTLQTKSTTLLGRLELLDNQITREDTISALIASIDSYISDSNMTLAADTVAIIKLGRKLGVLTDQTKDTEKALQALALVWTVLDTKERIDFIQTASPPLYKFLNGKNASEIQCLISSNCNGFITKVELKIGVYPAIEAFGINNIKNLLNQKGKIFIINQVNQVAYASLLTVHETILSEVSLAVASKQAELGQFSKNFSVILKTNWDNYLKNKGVTPVNGFVLDSQNQLLPFEAQNIWLRNKISQQAELQFGIGTAASDSGVANSANTTTTTSLKTEILKNQYELVENILRLPQFSQAPDAGSEMVQSDLLDLILSPKQRQYSQQIVKSPLKTVALNDQSQLLLTTSKLIRELADWKTSAFDKNLSAIQASEILTEFKTEALNRSFFAKSDLLALTLSVTSETLKLLQSASSPLILIDNNQKLIEIQDFNQDQSGPLALAAATDFIDGHRSNTVKTSDLSQFQLALIEFYSATGGLEKTNSGILRSEDAQGQVLLTQILDARKKIKVLIIAIGNFLSNQLQQKNRMMNSTYLLDGTQNTKTYQLSDQVIAVEALVRTYELTDIEVYLWSALDVYYAMNANLYNVTTHFYDTTLMDHQAAATDDANLKLKSFEVLNSYKSLLRLKPYLTLDSQLQLESIFKSWVNF